MALVCLKFPQNNNLKTLKYLYLGYVLEPYLYIVMQQNDIYF